MPRTSVSCPPGCRRKTSVPPVYRIGGHLKKLDLPVMEINGRYIEKIIHPLIPERRRAEFEKRGALDFAVSVLRATPISLASSASVMPSRSATRRADRNGE